MGLFDQFPYTNFHELNLDWILNVLKEIEDNMQQFVAINTLKYADPIQWNITTQYEKNTIVIDPQTGTAYISVQAVPSGVNITNSDYWAVVFDLSSFVVRAAKNFTNRYEADTTLTATFPSTINDWLIWGDTLYRATANIIAGDQYIEGSNIERFTAEDVIGHIQDLNTTDKSNLVSAINELVQALIDEASRVDDITGDLDDLDTTDKSNLVAAINEVISILEYNVKISENVHFYMPPNINGTNQDATFMLVINKRAVLFDCGTTNNRNTIFTYYQSLFTAGLIENIDTIIISHYHDDHIENLADILSSFPHDNCTAYVPMNFDGYYTGTELAHITALRSSVLSTFTAYSVPYVEVNSIMDVDLASNVKLTFLNSTPAAYSYYSGIGTNYYNNYSMVSLIRIGDTVAYYLSDIQSDAEIYMVDAYTLPKAYFCILNHHGEQWDDQISFMSRLSPFIGVFQTNTYHLDGMLNLGVFANYNVDHLFTTALGAITVSLNKSGGVIDGVEIFRKGTILSTVRLYVDNSYNGISTGTPDHPYTSINEALDHIPAIEKNFEFTIWIKDTGITYPTAVLQHIPNTVILRNWSTGSPAIKGIKVNECKYVGFSNVTIKGLQDYDASDPCLGLITNSTVFISSCTLSSDDGTRIEGLKLSGADVAIQYCTIDTLIHAYYSGYQSKVFAALNTFKNVQFCHSLNNTHLTIRSVDTIDANCNYYIQSSATVLMTPVDVLLTNTDDLDAFKTLCLKNGGSVLSNHFKKGDSTYAIVGINIVNSTPITSANYVDDLDNADTNNGFYLASGTTINKPTGITTGGYLLLMRADANACIQFFVPFNSTTIYVRSKYSGTYSTWKSITPV